MSNAYLNEDSPTDTAGAMVLAILVSDFNESVTQAYSTSPIEPEDLFAIFVNTPETLMSEVTRGAEEFVSALGVACLEILKLAENETYMSEYRVELLA